MGSALRRSALEQIVNKLGEAEVELAKGQTIATVVKKLGIMDETYSKWRTEYGGMKWTRRND